MLKGIYSLTNSEIGLVEQLALGLSLRESSERLGIVPETARSYLKAIFAKTDTHRQGELIALVDHISSVPEDLNEADGSDRARETHSGRARVRAR
jgi:DNA-binding CsgD family transcriptional regulator